MASFRVTEYEYNVAYFETLELLATLSKRIFREMNLMKRNELIRQYVTFYIAWAVEFKKFNGSNEMAKTIRKKRYGCEYGREPKCFCPIHAMTKEEMADYDRRMR